MPKLSCCEANFTNDSKASVSRREAPPRGNYRPKFGKTVYFLAFAAFLQQCGLFCSGFSLTYLGPSRKLAPMLRQYLLQEFERRSDANPQYSLRAFARDLEIHSGTLSGILNQRRTVGAKLLAQLITKLPLSRAEKKKILSEMITPTSLRTDKPQLIDEDILKVIKDWEHYAILAYVQLRKAKHSPGDIAKALGLTHSKVLKALNNLENVGLIKREAGKIQVTFKALMTSRGIPSAALREAHEQYIEKAKNALHEVEPIERDITGTTMAISHKNLPKAKELIQQFRLDLCDLLEQGEIDDVYRLNIQLFPLTRKTTETTT